MIRIGDQWGDDGDLHVIDEFGEHAVFRCAVFCDWSREINLMLPPDEMQTVEARCEPFSPAHGSQRPPGYDDSLVDQIRRR